MKLPVDTSAIAFLCALEPQPVLAFDTKQPRADENGEPLYVIQLIALAEGAAEDEPFGDELLHSAGGSLVADAVLTAEFGSAGQLVAGGVVGAGFVDAGQDIGADGIGDLAIRRLPREGHEVASQGSSSGTGAVAILASWERGRQERRNAVPCLHST